MPCAAPTLLSCVVVLLAALAATSIAGAAPYDDDDTPRKVELADLEAEQEQRQQLRQQQLPHYAAPTPQQQQQQQQRLEQPKNHHVQYTQPTRAFSFRPAATPAQAARGAAHDDGAADDFESLKHVQQLVYNDISAATYAARQHELAAERAQPTARLPPHGLPVPLAVQRALLSSQREHQRQQQENEQQQRSAYAALPSPYEREEADDAVGAVEQQQPPLQESPHFTYVPSVYQQAVHPQFVLTPTARISAVPALPSPLPPPVPYNVAGDEDVQYVSSNHLDDTAQPEVLGPNSVQRPVIVYGPPAPTQSLPGPSSLTPPPQRAAELARLLAAQQHSKQYAFAPARGIEETHLSPYASTIPYPPSFISITTTTTARPDSDGPARSAAYARYARPFRPSQPDPLPDFFSYRHSKSLIDSYIPSWVIAQMIQQQQQQQYRPLAYTSAIPYRRQYKRNSAVGRDETQQKPTPLNAAKGSQNAKSLKSN